MPSSDHVAAVRALARAARLLERQSAELSLAHYRVLSAVAGGDARASRIARRLALGKPAVSNAVDALRQRGLLERVDDEDHRVVALRLTPAGEHALADAETAMTAWLASVLDGAGETGVLDALVVLGEAIERRQAALAEAR